MTAHSSATPKISVVVTTYNRADLLKKVLLSLAAQTLADEDYELIVVDDGSTDATSAVIKSMQKLVSLRYVYQPNSGLASAKNHGLFCCRAPIVLFLDDDDIADQSLLDQHLAAHRLHPDPNIAVLGHTTLARGLASDPLMSFVTGVGGHLFSYNHIPSTPLLDYTYFWGGRTSSKRRYLLSHGVFNPVFRFGYEDIELGYRLNSHGLHVVYWPLAINTMIRKVSLQRFLRRCFRQGQSACRFLSLYPDEPRLASILSLADASHEWMRLQRNHAGVIQSAQHLDAMIRLLEPNQLQGLTYYRNTLHFAYARAFRAEVLRGYMDHHQSTTRPLVGASS